MKSISIFVSLLSLAGSVSAGGFGGHSIGGSFNFGCGSSITGKATNQQKDWCSGKGSFFTDFKGGPLCCSDHTRQPPSGITCPKGWSQHFQAGCCIPPKEVSPCDCGEGYTYDKNAHKCVKNTGKCHGGQWWHDRSDTCCDNGWENNPPKGNCPSGIKCPSGWFWHKDQKKCLPNGPHSPEPDCPDWDDHNHCCGGQTGPSQQAGHGGGNHGNHGQSSNDQGGKFPWGGKFNQADFENWWSKFQNHKGNHKRHLHYGQQALTFPQTDLDKMYCPGSLHACTVSTASGGEWAYECVDFATELEACGGCVDQGGADCTQIPHSLSVGCELGACAVYTCKQGFYANGTACAPNKSVIPN
ncbi:uncharacterized protein IL334_007575 [Kwoniella shivajii]|uniref:Protein CPL1-like domain-containing protein n=1 Tax=Kwoniella shivajii TaxID=564305 RepID=A0ABZ1DAG1_9TREE|nr:hypothetical protein IL334_007575 [Kwoniella shivajii]